MSTTSRRFAMLALLAATLAGCSSTPDLKVQPLVKEDLPRMTELANYQHQKYRIQAGDMLQIRYVYHPELKQEDTVRPDGKISANLVGELRVAGLTTEEMEKLLVQRTSGELRNPEVSVSVLKFAEKHVFIGGEVGKPGPVSFSMGLTPLQAIVAVGGFRETAALDSVVLVRGSGNESGYITRKINLAEVVTDGVKEPLILAPDDIVYVPRTPIADADLWVKQHIIDLIPFFRGAGFTVPATAF